MAPTRKEQPVKHIKQTPPHKVTVDGRRTNTTQRKGTGAVGAALERPVDTNVHWGA